MKKLLLFSGLFLCASAVYADASRPDQIAEGRKRNEEVYEQTLEQTGWINPKAGGQDNRAENQRAPQPTSQPPQPKSS